MNPPLRISLATYAAGRSAVYYRDLYLKSRAQYVYMIAYLVCFTGAANDPLLDEKMTAILLFGALIVKWLIPAVMVVKSILFFIDADTISEADRDICNRVYLEKVSNEYLDLINQGVIG
jgi:hypothetical protein